jgi:hypothetical protein
VSSRYVAVPAPAIRERLAGAGFRLLPPDSFSREEEVYERKHDRDSRYSIKVYSSISRGDRGVRGCGADAIRVVALFTPRDKSYPVFKASRVYRTGSIEAVLDRMIERAREAYAACNAHRRKS